MSDRKLANAEASLHCVIRRLAKIMHLVIRAEQYCTVGLTVVGQACRLLAWL